MPNESGEWIMRGLDWDNPLRIRTPEELIRYIEQVGFLPLFANGAEGFPWKIMFTHMHGGPAIPNRIHGVWREIIARSGQAAYGKFFDRKAGFISREWFPVFANYRRDGYDFDARYDDELASNRSKKIMDLFEDEKELYSFEVKSQAGFGKGGEKNFDGVITDLQMRGYILNRDFRRRRRKKDGVEYGWPIAVYTTPEHLWGYEEVTSAYREDPQKSFERIMEKITEEFPEAEEGQIRKMIR